MSTTAPKGNTPNPKVLARLTRFYEYYAPEKVTTAELALAAYAGREEAMFRALEKKYGPEADIPANSSGPPSRSSSRRSSVASVGERSSIPPFVPRLQMMGNAGNAYAEQSPAALQSPGKVRQRPDYHGALEAAGYPVDLIDEALVRYGPGIDVGTSEPDAAWQKKKSLGYNASIAMQLSLIPEEKLFDVSLESIGAVKRKLMGGGGTEGSALSGGGGSDIQMPNQALRRIRKQFIVPRKIEAEIAEEGAACDEVDEIAFQHIFQHRTVFQEGFVSHMDIRTTEARERQNIVALCDAEKGSREYRKIVLNEALRYIGPVEEERRGIITEEQRLRWEGLHTWFRQHRDEVLLRTRWALGGGRGDDHVVGKRMPCLDGRHSGPYSAIRLKQDDDDDDEQRVLTPTTANAIMDHTDVSLFDADPHIQDSSQLIDDAHRRWAAIKSGERSSSHVGMIGTRSKSTPSEKKAVGVAGRDRSSRSVSVGAGRTQGKNCASAASPQEEHAAQWKSRSQRVTPINRSSITHVLHEAKRNEAQPVQDAARSGSPSVSRGKPVGSSVSRGVVAPAWRPNGARNPPTRADAAAGLHRSASSMTREGTGETRSTSVSTSTFSGVKSYRRKQQERYEDPFSSIHAKKIAQKGQFSVIRPGQ